MVLKTIYVVRHGFRSNWVVNSSTGVYTAPLPTPTGIASDPSLASHGVNQSQQLATHLIGQTPSIDIVYSSPFYRCLQTLAPTVKKLTSANAAFPPIRPDTGLGEYYGLARFDHPIPATPQVLDTHFPDMLDLHHRPTVVPAASGESIESLHDRVASAIEDVIAACDAEGHETLLVCTHAAVMICLGRALTGNMPATEGEEDFRCGTCSFSKFVRKQGDEAFTNGPGKQIEWRGRGVAGGWVCQINGDCSFLEHGEERTWTFAMEDVTTAQQEKDKGAPSTAAVV